MELTDATAFSIVGTAGLYVARDIVRDTARELLKPSEVKSVEKHQRDMRAVAELGR
jgi:hypothetical protein